MRPVVIDHFKLCEYPKCRALVDFNNKFCENCQIKDRPYKGYINSYIHSNSARLKKHKVRGQLDYQIRKGNVIRQICEIKGCKDIGEAHHKNYNKPFDVQWLCKQHHEEKHHLFKFI